MSIFARIAGGIVAELFTPPAGVSIAQCFNAALTWAECDGTPGVAVGWAATLAGSTWTFTAPATVTPTLAQQAQALLAGGCQIVSTGTPAINGTYACDVTTRATIAEVVAGINAGDGFPGGGSTFNFPLANGTVVTFPATATFMAVAKALRDFIYACMQVIQGTSTTLPAATAAIA